MKLTVPRATDAHAPRTNRDRPLRRGMRVRAAVLNVFAGRIRLISIAGRRFLVKLGADAARGERLELEVTAVRPVPRFRAVSDGRTIWSIPVGRRPRGYDASTQG